MCTPFHLVDVEILYKISENLLVVLRDKSVDHHREYDLSSEDHQSPKVMAINLIVIDILDQQGKTLTLLSPEPWLKHCFYKILTFKEKKKRRSLV